MEKLIRADMVYFETPSGGRVFSTGSITFCGSLLHNDGDNNISRIVANVLDRFLARGRNRRTEVNPRGEPGSRLTASWLPGRLVLPSRG